MKAPEAARAAGTKGTDDEYGDSDDSTSDEGSLLHGSNSGPGGGDDGDVDDDSSSQGDGDAADEDDSEHGSGHGRHGHRNDRLCSTDELVEGAVVSEAELDVRASGLFFDEIELVRTKPAPDAS